MKMVIDVGNTNIKFVLFNQNQAVTFKVLNTKEENDFKSFLQDFLKDTEIKHIKAVIYVSVVERIDLLLKPTIKELGLKLFEINTNLKLNFKMSATVKQEIGHDLICLAYYAYHHFKSACLAISLGTASACVYLDDQGYLKYCLIFPGLKTGAYNLFSSAEKLKQINLEKVDTILAQNTEQALRSGIIYSYIGSIKYIIKEYQKELQTDFKVLLAGGLANLVGSYCDEIAYYHRDIVIQGALLIYEYNQ